MYIALKKISYRITKARIFLKSNVRCIAQFSFEKKTVAQQMPFWNFQFVLIIYWISLNI